MSKNSQRFNVFECAMQLQVLLILIFSISAHADPCLNLYIYGQFPNPLREIIQRSDAIFIGEVEGIKVTTLETKDMSAPLVIAQTFMFRVTDNILGKGANIKEIYYDIDRHNISCMCRYKFEIGKEYIVIASKISQEEDILTTYFCDGIINIGDANRTDINKYVEDIKMEIKKLGSDWNGTDLSISVI